MLLPSIPKRSIVNYPGEFKNFLSIANSPYSIKGKFIKEFEFEFKNCLGVKEAVAVSSGRFAMILILECLGLKKGDGVILSAYNFPGVPKALKKAGYNLQLVDADKETYQIDIEKIEEKINSDTKAIIVTHLFGQSADVYRIKQIARKHDLFIIEDAAHAFGTLYDNKPVGTISDAGFFSFTGSKALNTSFGGVAVTDNLGLAQMIRKRLDKYFFPKKNKLIKAMLKKYIYLVLANRIFYTLFEYPVSILMSLLNLDPLESYKKLKKKEVTENYMKFTNLQGLIGLKQIDFSEKLTQKRKKNAVQIIEKLKSTIFIQKIPENSTPNYFMLPLRVRDKIIFSKKLLKKGIDSNLHYASDCSFLNNENNSVSDFLSESILTINLPFNLKPKEIDYIADSINALNYYCI